MIEPMPRQLSSPCLLIFLIALAGCTSSTPPIPPVEQIAKVQLTITHFPANAGRKDGCQVTLTAQRDLTVVVDWLGSVDWSQAGIDLKVAKAPEPDGELSMIAKDAAVHEFGFYWDGRIIASKGSRLLSGADVTRLRQLVERECK